VSIVELPTKSCASQPIKMFVTSATAVWAPTKAATRIAVGKYMMNRLREVLRGMGILRVLGDSSRLMRG